MEALIRLINNVNELTPRELFNSIFRERPNLIKYIISLNLYNQLFDQGIDSEGKQIGFYSQNTESRNPNKPAGSPYTLHDTGEFYESVRAVLHDGEIELRSDELKNDGYMVEIYGEDILGLTEESQELLVNAIKDENIAEILRDMVLKGLY